FKKFDIDIYARKKNLVTQILFINNHIPNTKTSFLKHTPLISLTMKVFASCFVLVATLLVVTGQTLFHKGNIRPSDFESRPEFEMKRAMMPNPDAPAYRSITDSPTFAPPPPTPSSRP
uniref:Uncharacterized protein n=1 Tax=Strigamia maritima TaxID=126957 RepID=T1J7V2_STRMM